MKWGMAIDQKKCVGCYSCVVTCKQEHFLPPGIFWNRVLISETGKYPNVSKHIMPIRCNQCEDPKCVSVCPTGATQQRKEDGIVWIDPKKCMGCRYCLVVCPYQARSYYEHESEYFKGKGLTPSEEIGKKLYPHTKGAVSKCNFCMERIDEGLKKGLNPGIDREATPACVVNCPTKAMYFGDLDDPNSEVALQIKKKKGKQNHPEYNTDPSIYYLDY